MEPIKKIWVQYSKSGELQVENKKPVFSFDLIKKNEKT